MFIAIFYGIQIIWERDAGVLTKLLVTPTPRSALICGKSFAAGIRSIAQVVVVVGNQDFHACASSGSVMVNRVRPSAVRSKAT